jgi:hypothetical protein
VRWNATRFGTNYMFLDSMFRHKDNSWCEWVPRVSLRVHSALRMKEDMHILTFLI